MYRNEQLMSSLTVVYDWKPLAASILRSRCNILFLSTPLSKNSFRKSVDEGLNLISCTERCTNKCKFSFSYGASILKFIIQIFGRDFFPNLCESTSWSGRVFFLFKKPKEIIKFLSLIVKQFQGNYLNTLSPERFK